MDNLKLGYGGTKQEMERLLEDAEKLKAAHGEMAEYSIDSYADVVEAIHVVQTEMGITGTTAKEAASTVSGSIATLKAAWENLLAGMGTGDDLSKQIDDLVRSAETALDNLMPVVENALNGALEVFDKLVPIISEAMPGFISQVTPILLEAMGTMVGTIIVHLPEMVAAIVKGIWAAIEATGMTEGEIVEGTYDENVIAWANDAAAAGQRLGAEYTEGLDAASAATEKFAVKQMDLAPAVQAGTDALTEEEIAAQEAAAAATQSMAQIGTAAYEALTAGGDLGEAWDELSKQAEKLAGSGDAEIEALTMQALKMLETAATMQDLSEGYPLLVQKTQEFGYSLQETAQWLQYHGITAEEWAGQVNAATNNVVNGFSKLDTSLDMSLEDMAANMQSNIQAYTQWEGNIKKLMDAAVSSGQEGAVEFVQYLQGMGIGAADQVAAMMGDMEGTFATFGPMMSQAIGLGMGEVYQEIEGANLSSAGESAGATVPTGIAAGAATGQDQVTGAVQNVITAAVGAAGDVDVSAAGTAIMGSLASGVTTGTETVSAAAEAVANAAALAVSGVDFTPAGKVNMGSLALGVTGGTELVTGAAEAVAEAAVEAVDGVDFGPSGEAIDSEIAAGISGAGGDVSNAAEAVATAAAEAAKIDTSYVGLYFDQGLAAGIRNGSSAVITAAIHVMQAAVNAAKQAGQIASPSKVMRDEVGVWLTKGIAAGMTDPEALYALEEAADVVQTYIANLFGVDLNGEDSEAIAAVKAWKDAWTGALDDTVRNTEHSIFLMEKNGKDYNEIIAAYRSLQKAVHEQAEQGRRMGLTENDKYIQELQKDWWDYEDKIQAMEQERADAEEKARKERQKAVEEALDSELKAMQDMADDLTDEYQSAFDAIMKAQESMQNKLSSYGDLFHLTGTTVSLESLDSQTKFIERYGAVLEKLEGRGINGGLLDEILGMDVKSATFYGEKLMEMTNREWENYMSSYAAKQEAAARISEHFFGDEIQALNDDYVQNASEQMGGLFKQFLSEIPEGDELGGYMAQTLTETFNELMQEMLGPILGGNIGDLALDSATLNLAGAQEAAADNRAAERDQALVTAMGDMAAAIVNGIDASMENHMGQGESELNVEVSGETLARILLPYLIATAKDNGTPLVE